MNSRGMEVLDCRRFCFFGNNCCSTPSLLIWIEPCFRCRPRSYYSPSAMRNNFLPPSPIGRGTLQGKCPRESAETPRIAPPPWNRLRDRNFSDGESGVGYSAVVRPCQSLGTTSASAGEARRKMAAVIRANSFSQTNHLVPPARVVVNFLPPSSNKARWATKPFDDRQDGRSQILQRTSASRWSSTTLPRVCVSDKRPQHGYATNIICAVGTVDP